jgi:hypothetical protein
MKNNTVRKITAVQWLRKVVLGLSLSRLGFDPRPGHVDKMALGLVFLCVSTPYRSTKRTVHITTEGDLHSIKFRRLCAQPTKLITAYTRHILVTGFNIVLLNIMFAVLYVLRF